MSTFRAYLVTPKAGRPREWHTVAAEAGKRARELEGDAQPYELPATKAGLIPFLNSLEAEHAAAAAGGVELLTESPPCEHLARQAEPKIAENDDELGDKFDVRVLEQQVDRLGELGEKGLEQLEAQLELAGVGGYFSRGVHLLTIAAAGDHQLGRLFRRMKGRK